MSLGKLAAPITILAPTHVRDAEGFASAEDRVVARVRAAFDPKNRTEKWHNMAQFAHVDAMFKLRVLPGVAVKTHYLIECGGERYRIVSIEDVRGRGMYLEILAQKIEGSG